MKVGDLLILRMNNMLNIWEVIGVCMGGEGQQDVVAVKCLTEMSEECAIPLKVAQLLDRFIKVTV